MMLPTNKFHLQRFGQPKTRLSSTTRKSLVIGTTTVAAQPSRFKRPKPRIHALPLGWQPIPQNTAEAGLIGLVFTYIPGNAGECLIRLSHQQNQ